MRGLAVFFLSMTAALSVAIGAWQESIRVDVNLVNVAFSVRDANGAPVDNLTKDDFEVVEDAVPQKIAYFARSVDVSLTLGLIVDASGSQEHFTKKHQHDLEVFLKDVLGPKDRVFLVGFGNHIRLVSDFSESSADLMDAWKRYDKNTKHFPELGPIEERDLGTAFYDSIGHSLPHTLSTFFIIASAHCTLATINLSVRGLPCGPPKRSSAVCMCRLARIAAMILITRLRPSSIGARYHVRRVFAKQYTVDWGLYFDGR